MLLVHPDRKDAKQRRYGNPGGMRRRIETIIDTGKGHPDLEGRGGRTPAGAFTWIAQRYWPCRCDLAQLEINARSSAP